MKRSALRRGRFIVLEGLDGAGTTTQTERLARALREQGVDVLTTREPSDGPLGTTLRQALTGRLVLRGGAPLAPATLALLFAADRTDHLASQILPALEAGRTVICDRYVLSSLAYQGTELSMDWVDTLNAEALSPDLTVFVEVKPAVASRRRAIRGGAPELFEADAQQRKIARQYQHAIRLRQAREPIVTVDGSALPEAVTAAILEAVQPLLPRSRKAR